MTELLPCPFCGSPAVKSSFERVISGTITQIQCGNDDGCKVCVDTQHVNEAVAVEAWNTRVQPQRTREAALEAAALDFVAKVERGEARSERSYQAFKRALSITRPDDPPQYAPDREALVRAIQLSYARKDLEPTSATTLALYREDAENAADAVLALTRPECGTP